jgi:hypothetical protein
MNVRDAEDTGRRRRSTRRVARSRSCPQSPEGPTVDRATLRALFPTLDLDVVVKALDLVLAPDDPTPDDIPS